MLLHSFGTVLLFALKIWGISIISFLAILLIAMPVFDGDPLQAIVSIEFLVPVMLVTFYVITFTAPVLLAALAGRLLKFSSKIVHIVNFINIGIWLSVFTPSVVTKEWGELGFEIWLAVFSIFLVSSLVVTFFLFAFGGLKSLFEK